MVLEKLKDVVGPDSTYTYVCNLCGEEWETENLRHNAECPECGGPPKPSTGG